MKVTIFIIPKLSVICNSQNVNLILKECKNEIEKIERAITEHKSYLEMKQTRGLKLQDSLRKM